ncbi:cation acetate symporter [Haloterrigena sp. H1]|uniref:sodium:solute symporter family transporter n=1 Tax=Haloterrigena sp. H1 TaxID=2552943 RepID=UPI00110EEB54|nr:cation acetate symporter [Haloterrigena sp. H1]TMT85919.1 cation acetate symporter [Haloterrigena sp. H1]
MTGAGILLQSDLLPQGMDVSFKLAPAILVLGMLAIFLLIGFVFRVADTEDMWVAGRSIGNIENGMAIGANWMSAASYLGMAALIALSGFYGLAFVVGWTTGYFILLIFMAAQMRRFGKYTAPDFVGDRFNSDTARGIAAVTAFLIAFVYAIGQARGMALVGLYIFGDIGFAGLSGYQAMVIVMMAITVLYLTLSGMMGATKNMAVQYVILIGAFLAGMYVVGWTQGYSTVLPQIEYGMLISELGSEFSEPFATASPYLWIATCFSLVVGTCGLPHVLVRFYTVENERTARWSTVTGLFFILLLYLGAPAYTAFGVRMFDVNPNTATTYAAEGGMSAATADVLVVVAAQFANLPQWFVGFVAAGGIAAAIATTAGLFITGSSAVSHDIYVNLINEDATQRQQILVGRLGIVALGVLTTLAALDPAAPIGALVSYAFSLAGSVLFPMFFLGLWWENTNRQGALAGMLTGLTIWFIPMINEVLPTYISNGEPYVAALAQWLPAIGSALVGVPVVFAVTIIVSVMTDEPSLKTKKMVRQCHSPEPMGQQQSAEDVVTDGGEPLDD